MTLSATPGVPGEWVLWLAPYVQAAFVFAFGACIGSLTNVLVYRLPLGLDVVSPSSRCPKCETVLTWRENIPVLGWLLLRGRCRFCRSPISPEYPVVEAVVGVLWVVVFMVLYAPDGRFMGIPFGAACPDWAGPFAFGQTWPAFIMLVVLMSSLVAMTLVDAKTFHIPMILTWVPLGVGLVTHLAHGVWVQLSQPGGRLMHAAQGWDWTIATPGSMGWQWVGMAIGAGLGLVLSNVLLAMGVLRHSFADYPEWEKTTLAEMEKAQADSSQAVENIGSASPPADPEMWIQYPHARREMLRELLFLAPVIGLGLIGYYLAVRFAGPWTLNPATQVFQPSTLVPLWLDAFSGSVLGLLVGGGLVWGIRILGSLAFGKEALGLGDVHMMAAVGACLGWIDPVLAFFAGAILGVVWAICGKILSGGFRRAMPFGPYLAGGTMVVWFGKPLFERLLMVILHTPTPVNLP